MTTPDADRLFATFAQRGDPGALAQVFDLLAAELLLLAAHLAPPGVDAEDLLQATFVCAIEQRAKFERGRPVRPWLVGILGNLAREARKRAARTPDPQRLRAPADAEPEVEAQTQEVESTVAAAVAALPRLDRQVLTLRLVHGLSDAQIAHALAVPLPTAKARLRRGLVRLRQALPAGLARGMAVFAARGRDLKDVRAHVLAAAAVVGPAATAWSALVKAAALVAVLVAGGVAYAWPDGRAPELEAARAPASVRVEPAVAESTPVVSASPVAAAPARAEIAQVVPGLCGRCVARESGEPLAGCEIEARLQHPFAATAEDMAAWQRADQRPVTATSAEDGTFTLPPLPEATRFKVAVVFRARDRADAALSLPRGDASRDLGDVRLARPVPVFVRVIDTRGNPVASAQVSFMANSWLQTPDALQDHVAGGVPHADADGQLSVQPGLAPGTWLLQARDHALIAPTAIAIEEGATRIDVEVIVLRRTPEEKLAGVVQDSAGQALPGVWVSLDGETNGASTDQSGAFLIQRHSGPDAPGVLRLRDFDGRAAPTTVAGPFVWGRTDLVLTMAAAESVRVRVSDAQSDLPVAEFAVQRSPSTGVGANPRLATTQPEPGVTDVPAVEWGVTNLRVVPEGADYEPSSWFELERRDVVDGVLTVQLQRRGELRVRVRRSDHSPVPGSTVEVLIDPGAHLPAQSLSVLQLYSAPLPGLFAALLDTAVTDADGVAVLRVAPASGGRALRVRGGHPEIMQRDIAVQPGALIDITVTAAAHLRGSVGPAELLRELRDASPAPQANDPFSSSMQVGLVFRPAEGAAPAWPTPLDAEGRFDVIGLPVGRCAIELNHVFRRGGGYGRNHRTPLAVVDLRPGDQDLVLDLAPARPATLHAVVVAGDRPCTAGQVSVHAEAGSSFSPLLFATFCDASGSFVVPGIPAHTYRIYLEQRDHETGRSLWVPSAETCDVRPGATVHARFHIERRTARVRVLHADGRTPVVDQCLQVTPALLPPTCRTDADGWLTVDPAPAGPFALRAAVEQGPANWQPTGPPFGALELPAGERTATLTVCLPAAR